MDCVDIICTVYCISLAPSSAPSAPVVHSYTSRSIALTWEPPQEEDLNGVLHQFVIHLLEYETGRTWNETSKDVEYMLEDLHPYYTYSVAIAAETISVGPFSSNTTIQLAEDGR